MKTENKEYVISECFACYSGYKCEPETIEPEKERELKSFLNDFGSMLYFNLFGEITICHIATDYKRLKPLIDKHSELLKYKEEILFIKEIYEDTPIYLDENGRLGWYWEYDCDVTGGSSGVMAFCYSKEEAKDTWAFSEVKSLVEYVGNYIHDFEDCGDFIYPKNIKSDKDLLEHIRTLIKTKP